MKSRGLQLEAAGDDTDGNDRGSWMECEIERLRSQLQLDSASLPVSRHVGCNRINSTGAPGNAARSEGLSSADSCSLLPS